MRRMGTVTPRRQQPAKSPGFLLDLDGGKGPWHIPGEGGGDGEGSVSPLSSPGAHLSCSTLCLGAVTSREFALA